MGELTSRRGILYLLFQLLFGPRTERSSEQTSRSSTSPKCPKADDRVAWLDYWQKLGQPWSTEPEIDTMRQEQLAKCCTITPNIEQGIYPFQSTKLNRADVEWLLRTHEHEYTLVDWKDESRPKRKGLDLRGADLCHVDLHNLPLAGIRAGLSWNEWKVATEEQRTGAVVLMEGTDLSWAHLEEAILSGARLKGANLSWAHLEKANLYQAHLEGAILRYAHLKGVVLRRGQLKEANLFRAHLEEANLSLANFAGADLRSAFFDNATTLRNVIPYDAEHGFISVADTRWADVNLALIKWPQRKWTKVLLLGDESEARRPKTRQGKIKDKAIRLAEYETAVRANRQLATALRDQGLHELADHFAYRAQLLQRVVWRRQWRLLKYTFSWFLYLIAGYGYQAWKSVVSYLLIIMGFAVGYYFLGQWEHIPLSCWGSLVYSVMSFHGRGFFPGTGVLNLSLDDLIIRLAALEAVIGLFIEISFIATFTQRFLGK